MSKKMNLNEYANILFEKKGIKHEIKNTKERIIRSRHINKNKI